METNATGNQYVTTIELEKAVVCSLLLSQENLPDVTGWLTPEMFYCRDTAFVYSAMLQLYERGDKPDYLNTEIEMQRMDAEHCQQIGGINVLAESIAVIRHHGNLHHYAQEVKRLYSLRSLALVLRQGIARAQTPETDPEQLVAEISERLVRVEEDFQQAPPLRPIGELMRTMIDLYKARAAGEIEDTVVLTGLNRFDSIFGGMQGGELYVLGGRPGDGKTAIALHMAIGAARRENMVCFFSMEMGNQQLMQRIFTGHTDVDSNSLRTSTLTEEEFEAMEALQKSWEGLPLHMDYTPGNTAANIRAQIVLQSRKRKCDLVVVDYLHLLSGGSRHAGETQDQIIGSHILALKRVALETDCAILVLSQMNRQIETRADKNFKPNLNDLRDSGVIEQAADGVIFVYRPDKYDIRQDPDTGEDLRGTCDLVIRKNRNGSTGVARLQHNATFTCFADKGAELTFF